MKSIERACGSRDEFVALLRGELAAAEEQSLQSHLDTCAECQNELSCAAAERDIWREASELLTGHPVFSGTSENDSADDSRVNLRRDLQIHYVLEALSPTDDPQMLGRLGGYEVSGVIGTGGMGVVLKAHDRSLDRVVAIKVLAPHLASSGAARKRFAREAKAAAAVLHANVIAIYSVANDGPLPYLVMPYIKGNSLQKRLDTEGPLPLADILRIGAQVAAGLAAAHEQGLVHRDIKPANILLEDGVERVTITDFGLARAVDDASMTRSGVIAGTPQYMSPEQGRGESLTAASDLFSLGSLLYAMCTGHPPFRAETSFGVLHRIAHEHPRSPREINSSIPDWLCRLIETLHAKSPSNRYASAVQVAELLQQCLAHVHSPGEPLPGVLLDKPPAWHRWSWAIGAATALALVGTYLGMVSSMPHGQQFDAPHSDVPTSASESDEHAGVADEDAVPVNELQWIDTSTPDPETIRAKARRIAEESQALIPVESE